MAENYEALLGQLQNPYGDGSQGGRGLANFARTYGLQALQQANGDPVLASQILAEQKAANRGGFSNTLKRIGSAAPKVAALAAVPATLGAAGGIIAGGGGLAGAASKIKGGISAAKGAIDQVQNVLPGDLSFGDIMSGVGGVLGVHDQIKGRKQSGQALKRLQSVRPVDLSDVFQSDSPYKRPLTRMPGA